MEHAGSADAWVLDVVDGDVVGVVGVGVAQFAHGERDCGVCDCAGKRDRVPVRAEAGREAQAGGVGKSGEGYGQEGVRGDVRGDLVGKGVVCEGVVVVLRQQNRARGFGVD